MHLGEVLQGRGQKSGGERGRVTNAQAGADADAAHAFEHLVGLLEQVPGFTEKRPTNGRELDRVRLPLQEALPEFVLQRLDLPTQGGLGQENPLAARLMLPSSATATK